MQAPSNIAVVIGTISADFFILMLPKTKDEELNTHVYFKIHGIRAPFLGNETKEDEPFAYESREYVRQLLIGKEVSYHVVRKGPEKQKAELFGEIFYNNMPLSSHLLQLGYASLDTSLQGNFLLAKIESDAKGQGLGKWTKDPTKIQKSVRNLSRWSSESSDINACLKVLESDKYETSGIIEHVQSVTNYNLYIPKYQALIKFSLRCLKIHQDAESEVVKAGKMAVERLIQHRTVNILFDYIDPTSKIFYGKIKHHTGLDLSEEMLKNGYVLLHLEQDIKDPYYQNLKKFQIDAQKSKLGIWKAKNYNLDKSKFYSKVTEIHSGDSITVKNKLNEEKRIFLAGIKAPTLNKTTPQPFANDSKEYLRKLLIGREVEILPEYVKNIPSKDDPSKTKTMEFATVLLDGKNVSVMMLESALANLMIPKQDDNNVSKELTEASNIGKQSKKNIFCIDGNKGMSLKWLIGPQNINISKDYFELNFRGNQNEFNAVFDGISSTTRYKLRIVEHKCVIPAFLLGIRTVKSDYKTLEEDAINQQGIEYVKENILQREGKVKICGCDKKGNYIVVVTFNNKDLATTLVAMGFAYVKIVGSISLNQRKSLYEAQKDAKKNKLGIWKGNLMDKVEYENEEPEKIEFTKKMTISEVENCGTFYSIDEKSTQERLKHYEKMKNIDVSQFKHFDPKLPIDTKCIAKYSVDNLWYRASYKGRGKNDTFRVLFIDYGNSEEVTYEHIRLSNDLNPGLAMKCSWAYLEPPIPNSEADIKLCAQFKSLIEDKQLELEGCYSIKGINYVLIRSISNKNAIFNEYLLKNGICKISFMNPLPVQLKHWINIEKEAQIAKKGVWNDALSNEEEDY